MRILTLNLCGLLLASTAIAVNTNSYRYRQSISFPGASQPLTNFPVLLKFNPASTNFYSGMGSPDGADLRFTDASMTTELPFEFSEWNTNGVSSVWVKVPVLSHTNTIHAFWGNPFATQPPTYTNDGSVWEPSYTCVWHLDETGGPAPGSSVNAVSAQAVGGMSATNGIVSGSRVFDGASGYLLADIPGATLPTLSLEAWIYPTAAGVVFSELGQGGINIGWHDSQVEVLPTGELRMRVWLSPTYSAGIIPFNQWTHVSLVFDDTVNGVSGYVNGVQQFSDTYDKQYPGNLWFGIGAADSTHLGDGTYFDGMMDEVRISHEALDPQWIQATVQSVVSNQAFVSYGPVTYIYTPPVPGTGLIQVEGGTLTVRGQLSASNLIIRSAATLQGDGTVEANTHMIGTLSPGVGSAENIGTLSISGDVVFVEGSILQTHVAGHTSIDRLDAAGAVSGTSTVALTATPAAYPINQVVMSGNAASDMNQVTTTDAVTWRLQQSGSTELLLTHRTGDTDEDQLPDWWEDAWFGNRTIATPGGNLDNDAWNNLSEFLADTVPTDSNSVLKITQLSSTGSVLHVEWQGGIEAQQIIEANTSLISTNWVTLFTNHPPTLISEAQPIVNGSITSDVFYLRIRAAR